MSTETVSTSNTVEDGHQDDRPRYDDINTGVIFLIGVITTIVTIITIAFVQGLTYHWESKLQEETSYEVVDTPAKAEVDSQKAKLQYDPKTGAISIEDAMNRVLDQFGQKGEVIENPGEDETSTSNEIDY